MTNEQLALQAKDGDREALETLWTSNQNFIKQQAKKYSAYIEPDDALQECYFCLLDAVAHYDQEQGAAFITYLSFWIRGHLQRTISKQSQLPINKYDRAIRYRQTVAKFERDNGRAPTDAELQELLDITPDELQTIKTADMMDRPASLDAVTTDDDGDAVTLADAVPDPEQDPEADAIEAEYQRERAREIWDTVDTLQADQAQTIRDRYQGDGHTLQDVADKQGRTLNQIEATERKALQELRRPKRARRLRPYYAEIYGDAMRGEGSGTFNKTWTSSTERVAIKLYNRERGETESEF